MTDRADFEAWILKELLLSGITTRETEFAKQAWRAGILYEREHGFFAGVTQTQDEIEKLIEGRVQAAIKAERESITSLVEQSTLRARQTRAWGDAKPIEPCEIAAAIRNRQEAP